MMTTALQTVLIVPEAEWLAVLSRLARLEQQQQSVPPPRPSEPDEVLTVREAARLLGITEEGIRKARRAKRLKGVRINEKSWGFHRSELQRYLNRYNRVPLDVS